ncbi:hypothetical protein GOV12_03695 [Candidatus Pacearchaeota archaeon]|nr:hypothetical protein [Candidatus Pacearchaeota archaeon]
MVTLDLCTKAAIAGGTAAKETYAGKAEVKETDFAGSHAITTRADFVSQQAILERILSDDIKSYFITEEHVEDVRFRERLIGVNDLDEMIGKGVFVIDELDGSSSRAIGHYEWSVSVGYVENMENVIGAVYAPNVFGGALFHVRNKGDGAWFGGNVKDCFSGNFSRVNVVDREISDSYVIFGPDCPIPKYPLHNELMNKVAEDVRTVNINGSCALPMGLVAAGMADCLIEPLVCPWDWAGGLPIVQEAGGKVVFYEMPKGTEGPCVPVDKLEPRHYYPGDDKRILGLVAGNSRIVDYVGEMLFK